MATFHGYLILIVGLSVLLAMAGVQTTAGFIAGQFITINATSPGGNFTADMGKFHAGIGGSAFLIALMAILGTFALVGGIRAAFGGVQGIGETVKVTTAVVLIPLMIVDLVGIMNYANGLVEMGGILKLIAIVIYLPLAVGAIVSAIDWIGGGK
jgi:hypothetical protein